MTRSEREDLQPLVRQRETLLKSATIIDALIGMRMQLERTIDVPCCVCGHTIVVIGQGDGTHVASLNCASCNRHRGWLPKTIADFLFEMISRFGRPTDNITIRNSEFAQSESAAPSGAPAAANISHPEPDNERN